MEVMILRFDKSYKVVKAPDGLASPLYRLTKKVVKAMKMKESLVGTKEEVLAKAAKMNAKNRHFSMPTDNKAHYTDHMIQDSITALRSILKRKGVGMLYCSSSAEE